MKKARLILAVTLMVVLFSSCVRDHDYLYCDDPRVRVVNNTFNHVMYYSWDGYTYYYLYPGESTPDFYPYSPGSVRLDLDNPDVVPLYYRFGNDMYTTQYSISIDDCSKVIYID